MSRSLSRLYSLALAAGLGVSASSVASALPVRVVTETCPAIDPPASTRAPLRAGLRVFVDPVTGKIRPATPEERRKVATATPRDRSSRTYEMTILRDGTRIVKLDDAFLMNIVATVQPDGRVTYHCGPGTPTAVPAPETSK
jgi:hypothetical protein